MNQVNSRVLLVDDNKDAVDMVSQFLSIHHIDNKVAYDGASAVAMLADWPADIVFLDIQMPGMDGYETAIAMHALPRCAALPIVAWTGWDGPVSQEAAAHAHMVLRLTKPVVMEELLALVSRFGRHAST